MLNALRRSFIQCAFHNSGILRNLATSLMRASERQPLPSERDATNARALHFSTSEFNATVEESLQKWFKVFNDKQITEPLESIANILASVLKTSNLGEVYQKRKVILSDLQLENVAAMCEKRLQKMPVQYIIGEWDFREITLKLRPPVFIPRPETEILAELALQDIKKRDVQHILELCCGSGAISLSLLHNIHHLRAMCIDKLLQACRLCRENAEGLKLSDRIEIENCSVGDFNCNDKFDTIVSNPPYVLSKDMMGLQPEILLYEDADALDGGEDGLNIVKQILNVSSRCLNPGGRLFLEVDISHPELIRDLLTNCQRLSYVESYKDLAGETRFVEIIKNCEETAKTSS